MYVAFVAMFMTRKMGTRTMGLIRERNLKICRMTGNARYAVQPNLISKRNKKSLSGGEISNVFNLQKFTTEKHEITLLM